MTGHRISAAVVMLCVGTVPVSYAMTVDEVVERYVEARGGRAAWAAIDSMKVTGEFTAFSKIAPFTLIRVKEKNRYLMDHMQGDKKVVVGYDGRKAWWSNEWFGEGAREISGPDLAVVQRDVEFVPPLFDYAERGFEVSLIGETEVEGIPAIGVELARDDDSKETYYLDPGTYLEIARDSPGSDFGRPMTQRTWYEDFREVDGIVVPFFTETQWYTRDRVMRVERVATNVAVDNETFRMPAPIGMGPLQSLAGEWKVALESRQSPDQPFESEEFSSTIESHLRGALLEERFTTGRGTSVVRAYSYDKFRETYRVTSINDVTTYLNIQEGDFADDGKLVVTNAETGTPAEMFGMVIHDRISLVDIEEDAFKIEHEVSIDAGENWWVARKASYTRADDE